MALTDVLAARKLVVLADGTAQVTAAGARFLTELGVALPGPRSSRRPSCRLCLDWTERRPHIAGPLGTAIANRCFELGWLERAARGQAIVVTPAGRRGFQKTFGIDASSSEAAGAPTLR